MYLNNVFILQTPKFFSILTEKKIRQIPDHLSLYKRWKKHFSCIFPTLSPNIESGGKWSCFYHSTSIKSAHPIITNNRLQVNGNAINQNCKPYWIDHFWTLQTDLKRSSRNHKHLISCLSHIISLVTIFTEHCSTWSRWNL